MMIMDAVVFTIIYKAKKKDAMKEDIEQALAVVKGNINKMELIEARLAEQSKTIESLRTALNMKQLGR